jgi:hypothetical protein
MSKEFKEPKPRRFSTWPLIITGFVSTLALGMTVITPAGSWLFAPDRLDGSDAGKLKQEISYCRVPAGSSDRVGRVLSRRAEPVLGWNARRGRGERSGG